MKTKAKISNRIDRCNCGCQGKDSWHARHFTRIITITSEKHEDGRDSGDGFTWLTVARGTAKFPWGFESVHLRAVRSNETGKITKFGWKRDAAY